MLQLLDQAALRARVHSRSYWRMRYTDGRVVNEWDCDWSLAPLRGRQAVRLYCPNGQIAELGNDSQDCSDRLFQLKVAVATAGVGNTTLAHLIGLVDGLNGECRFAAWDYAARQLVTGRDNVHDFTYQQIGPLAFEHLGLKPD